LEGEGKRGCWLPAAVGVVELTQHDDKGHAVGERKGEAEGVELRLYGRVAIHRVQLARIDDCCDEVARRGVGWEKPNGESIVV